MAQQICTKCGYEGRGKQFGERRGGGLFRVLGILTMLPFHTLWRVAGGRAGKQCPHCSLPTMVKVNSDAGRLARHMMDVELGLIKVKKPEQETKPEGFGNERPAEVLTAKRPVDPEQF